MIFEMKIIIIASIIFYFNNSLAKNIGVETGLELPRFVSLKSDNSNIRVGPSKNYPIVLKYIIKDFPLMIIDEYLDWRKVEDYKKNTGWIHKSLIKGERFGITITNQNIKIKVFNIVSGKAIGQIGNENIIYIEKCKLDWCLISKNQYKGWVAKKNIWGVNNEEIFKIGFQQFLIDFFFKTFNSLEIFFTNNKKDSGGFINF